MSVVTTPRAPRATTAPGKSAPSRSRVRVTTSPPALTSSIPRTAVARLPLRSPEPWVPVAQAPAREMWGREAVLWMA